MKLLIAVFVLLISAVFSIAQQKKDTFEFVEQKGSQTVKLVFKTKPFVRANHKVEISGIRTKVDGRVGLGTDGNVPRTEIASVRLFWNKVEIPVPKNLYADCFEPNLEADYFRLKFGDDGESLLVFMAGSDAAGGYQVFWVFRKDGKHSRFSEACSDCSYIDFMNGFFGS
jgi:hypothetical protein